MRGLSDTGKWFFGSALMLTALSAPGSVCAGSKETVLYRFQGGSDGALPYAGVIADASGNLYGTTNVGGGTGCGGGGCGTVFKLAPDGTETVLYSFQGGTDGSGPFAGLVEDASGNLYGTTSEGGGTANAGIVFELAANGAETILYSFCSQIRCADGGGPQANLIMDGQGNLYGAAGYGGRGACRGGCGVVFKLAPGGAETVLYAFKGGADGGAPDALIMDGSGNLYGTTAEGGNQGCFIYSPTTFSPGCGTIFEIAASGTKKTLYTFCSQPNCTDGYGPSADIVMDDKGNLYGPTCCGYDRIVYKLAPDGTESVLHIFTGPPDGVSPVGVMVVDKKGDLYGATLQGGTGTGCEGDIGCGTVFKLAPDGTETVLYSFQHGTDGNFPYGGVIADKAGNLFGTTDSGGGTKCTPGCGTIFEIRK
ncbi:MAG: choice-of-anchor tandem repeat GloVer-containing protein [Rhizomicrobium sp.]|jgi:uncharacterized repeat protein (TIGR03803 family)